MTAPDTAGAGLRGTPRADPWAGGIARFLADYALAVAAILISGTLLAVILLYQRDQAIASAQRLAESLAHVVEEQTTRTIQTVDQRLQLAELSIEQLEHSGGLNPHSGSQLLRAQIKDLPFVSSIWILDGNGRIAYDANEEYVGAQLGDREYFKVYQERPETGFEVSAPIRSRTTNTWLIAATRPLRAADGHLTGIIVAALEPPYFDQLWGTIGLGAGGSVALFRSDGLLMMRSPFQEAALGKRYSGLPAFASDPSAASGHYQFLSPIDGVARITGYRLLSAYPQFMVTVGQANRQVLAQWQRFALAALLVWAAASATLALLSMLIARAGRERDRAVQTLRANENNLAITLQSIGDAVIATDATGRITRMNPVAERLTGWSLDEVRGRPLSEVFRISNARTNVAVDDPVARVMASGAPVALANHTKLTARDGREFQISDSAAPIRNTDGHIEGVVLVFSDVTEAYRLRENLEQTTALLERTGEMANIGGWELYAQAQRVTWSRQTARIFEEDPSVTPTLDQGIGYYTEASQPVVRAAVAAAFEHGTPLDLVVSANTARGRLVWLHIQARAEWRDGQVIKIYGTVQDVTQARSTEGQLHLLESAVSRLNDILLITEAEPTTGDGPRIVYVNEAFERRTGYTREEVLGRTPRLLQGPETQQAELKRIAESLKRWQPIRSELVNYTKSGEPYWIEMELVPIADAAGWYTHWVAVERDITQRKLAEQSLRESEQRLRLALKGADLGLWDWQVGTGRFAVDARWLGMLGLDTSQSFMESERFQALVHPDDVARTNAAAASLSGPGGGEMEVEFRARHADGRYLWILSKGAVVERAANGKALRAVGTHLDIDARRQAEASQAQLEAQLRESQKMEAIGTLAGGIAHDFNNIIASILGNAEMASEDARANPLAQQSLTEILKAARRARNLVQQILSFSRRHPAERRLMALAPVVEESVRLLRATLPARLELTLACAPALPPMLADATQIEQILLNLATNAMQSMPTGAGHIQLRVDTVEPDPALVARQPQLGTLLARHPGQLVRIQVQDDGPGMDAATQARIFEPFFTTKPPGEGTGLGLSVVLGIVQSHEGVILVDSAPGQGTTFTLYLPVAQGPVVAPEELPEPPAPAPVQSAPGADGPRLLYLDDDESLVFLVRRLLQRRGFRVSGFCDQELALSTLRRDPQAFDLVLTDYNMRGLSGLDVARAVRTIRADLPVLIASGFIDEHLRSEAGNAGVRELIFKASAVEDFCAALIRYALPHT